MTTETSNQAEVGKEASQGQPQATKSLLGAEAAQAAETKPVEDAAIGGQDPVPADDAKEADEPKSEDKGDESKDDADEAIPEDFEFKVPEGEDVVDGLLPAFRDVARELELPKGKAQALLSKMLPAMRQHYTASIQATVKGWEAEAAKDKEIGGSKLQESVKSARHGIESYFEPEFIDLLNASGLGSHKAVIRGFAKLGRDLSSDTFAQGAARRGPVVNLNDPTSVARVMFPNEA